MNKNENILGTKSIRSLVFSMGLPIIFSMLIQALYNIVDSIFVSEVSQNALTAVSLVFPIQNLMIAVAVGTAIGMNAILSKRLGEKKQEEANSVANNGVILAFFSSIVFALLGIFGSRIFLEISSDVPEVIAAGTSYMQICTIFSLGIFMQITFERIVQVTGKTTYQMAAQLTGAIINIALDPIFIFGYLGAPELGVAGAAVATVIGQWSGMIVCVVLNQKFNREVRVSFKKMRLDSKAVVDIYRVGFPSIIMQSIGSVMVFGMNQILGGFTEVAVNVFGIYFKLISFVFMPVFGLTSAFIPIVGYNFGAGNKDRIIEALKVVAISAFAIMTAGTCIFMIFPAQLISFFNPTEELYEIGIPALRVLSLAFPIAGVCIVFSSLFQALGKGMYSLWMSIGRQLLVILPVAFALGQIFGLDAVWFAMFIAEFLAIALAVFFFKRLYRNSISKLN